MKTEWFPLENRKRRFKGNTRHYLVVCCWCGKRKKNITLHFKAYHPKEYGEHEKQVQEALARGSVGVIDGIRFISSRC